MGSKLSKSQVDAICNKVYRRFPEMRGTRPRVKTQGANGKGRFLLLFKSRVTLDDGASMPVTVRAVADSSGRVIKISSSR
jgi:hypothetical protein